MDASPFATTREIVLFVLALWGAGLSTYTFLSGVRKDRRRVTVSLSFVYPILGPELGPEFIKIEAVNIGHRPVTVTTLTMEIDGKRLFPMQGNQLSGMPDTSLPAVLNDGQSAHLYMRSSAIAQSLLEGGFMGSVALTPLCVDSTGTEHKGKAKSDFNLLEAVRG